METAVSDQSQTVSDPTVCGSCGNAAENGRSAPLCASCRAQLAARPLPRWISVAAVVLLVPFGFALLSFPSALSASLSFERGRRAEAHGNFGTAVVEYSKVVQRFPGSTRAIARQGIAAFHDRQYRLAAQAFHTIAGRDASSGIVHEVNEAIDEMNKGKE
jgi:hypothetical protein